MSKKRLTKEEQLRKDACEKLMADLTNPNRTTQQLERQFFLQFRFHEKYPFMTNEDYQVCQQSYSNARIYNVGMLGASGVLCTAVYKVLGGLKPSANHPVLRTIRHFSVIGLSTLISCYGIRQNFPSPAYETIYGLTEKYRPILLDPQNNKLIVEEQVELNLHNLSPKKNE